MEICETEKPQFLTYYESQTYKLVVNGMEETVFQSFFDGVKTKTIVDSSVEKRYLALGSAQVSSVVRDYEQREENLNSLTGVSFAYELTGSLVKVKLIIDHKWVDDEVLKANGLDEFI